MLVYPDPYALIPRPKLCIPLQYHLRVPVPQGSDSATSKSWRPTSTPTKFRASPGCLRSKPCSSSSSPSRSRRNRSTFPKVLPAHDVAPEEIIEFSRPLNPFGGLQAALGAGPVARSEERHNLFNPNLGSLGRVDSETLGDVAGLTIQRSLRLEPTLLHEHTGPGRLRNAEFGLARLSLQPHDVSFEG